jgi:hypothetical protein
VRGKRASRHGQFRCDQHSARDRLAMAEPPVFRDRLDRVTGGMAEIENPPQACSFSSASTTAALIRTIRR